MRAVLDRLDERLREGLIKPTGRTGKGISAVLTVLGFILLMMTRTLKSTTFNIVGEDYHFALGINMDITNMVRAGQMISELTATSGELQQTLMQDARSQLEELLRECISAVGKEPDAMKKTDRMRIIRMLYKRRAFTYQKSVAIVAERLNVSRYTVYKYMHELEEAEAAGSLVQD